MRPGAATPEELESLFEDRLVIGERDALAELFEDDAVLVAASGAIEARGGYEIARFATAMCDRGYTYIADPRRVLQARDTTLVVAERAINVMRRRSDRSWRYAISLLQFHGTHEGDNR